MNVGPAFLRAHKPLEFIKNAGYILFSYLFPPLGFISYFFYPKGVIIYIS